MTYGTAYADKSKELTCSAFDNHQNTIRHLKIIKSEKYYDIKDLNFGFNLELAQTSKGNYNSQEMINLARKLRPNALRYPGGTPANYFNWQTKKLDEQQVKKQANKHINALLKRLKNHNNGKVPSADLKSFAVLSNNFAIKPFIVLNMFEPDKQIIGAIDTVKKQFTGTVFWELGNEVSNEAYQKIITLENNEPWSADIYARKIKAISRYIKSKFPSDQIGVVASEMAKWRNPNARSTWRTEWKRETWDETIVESMNDVDAVIVHPYIYASDKFIDDIDLSCKSRDGSLHNKKHRAWIMSNASNLPALYTDRLSKRFPGKKIWLTEFGVLDQHGTTTETRLQRQTGFRALSITANYLSWMQKYPVINTWLTHGMFIGYDWAHIVYPDLSYTATGIAYSFIRTFIGDTDEIASVALEQQPALSGIDSYEDMHITPIVALAGLNKSTGEHSIILANVTDHNLVLELPWRAKSIISKDFKWEEIVKPGKYKSMSDFSIQQVNRNVINILPGSINLIFTD